MKKSYIVTKNPQYFERVVGFFEKEISFCKLEDMVLPKRVAIDSETDGLDSRVNNMFCVQIGTGRCNYLIDLQDYSTVINFKEYENITYYFEDLIPYLENRELVFQNASFDLGFFYRKNFFPKVVFDTYLASKIRYNGYPLTVKHGLGDIFKRELDLEIDKFEQKNIATVKLSQISTIIYSFLDVDRLLEAHDSLWLKLTEYGAIETYLLHCRYIRALAYMEQCGLPINTSMWKQKMLVDETQSKLKAYEIVEYIWEHLPIFRDNQISLFDETKRIKILLSSAKQMIPVFQALGINTKNDENKDSIEEGVLKKSKHEFVKLWLEYQKAEHRVTTFGKNILDKVVYTNNKKVLGRLYTRFNPIVDTGRISTRKGDINFLNFPADKETRQCFEANEGFKFIVCDYAGQETVVGADITGDKMMIKSILEGACLHCAFARLIFPEIENLTDDEIKKFHSDKRKAAKSPRFAFQFGGTGYTVAMNEGIPIEEGMRLESLYKKLHLGVYEWGEEEIKKVLKQGYIENAAGFKLRLPDYDNFLKCDTLIKSYSKEWWEMYRAGKNEYTLRKESIDANKVDSNITIYNIQDIESYEHYLNHKEDISKYFKLKSQYFRLTLNAPTQGTAAHQTKLAVVMLFDFIEENNHYWDARLSLVCHDEIDMEVTDDLVDIYVEKVGLFMRKGGDYFLKRGILKMEADAHADKNWYTAK